MFSLCQKVAQFFLTTAILSVCFSRELGNGVARTAIAAEQIDRLQYAKVLSGDGNALKPSADVSPKTKQFLS